MAGDNCLNGEDFVEVLIDCYLERVDIDRQSLSQKELSVLYKQSELCKIGPAFE